MNKKVEQAHLPVEMPQTDEAKPRKPKVNCLQDMLLEILHERGLKDADIVKAIGVAPSTFHDWIMGVSEVQLTDNTLFKLFTFLEVPLHYLVYGVGSGEMEDGATWIKFTKIDEEKWKLKVGPKTFHGKTVKECREKYKEWVEVHDDDIA